MYPAPPPFCDQNKRKPRSQAQCTPCDDMSSQPAARCAVCGHQETNHAVERGQRGACGVLRCRCRQWTPPSPLPRPSYSGPRERNRRVKSARSAPVLAQVDLTRRCSDATSAGRSGGPSPRSQEPTVRAPGGATGSQAGPCAALRQTTGTRSSTCRSQRLRRAASARGGSASSGTASMVCAGCAATMESAASHVRVPAQPSGKYSGSATRLPSWTGTLQSFARASVQAPVKETCAAPDVRNGAP